MDTFTSFEDLTISDVLAIDSQSSEGSASFDSGSLVDQERADASSRAFCIIA